MSLAYKPLMFMLLLLQVGLGASPPLLATLIYECYHSATCYRTPLPWSHHVDRSVSFRSCILSNNELITFHLKIYNGCWTFIFPNDCDRGGFGVIWHKIKQLFVIQSQVLQNFGCHLYLQLWIFTVHTKIFFKLVGK